MLKQIIKFIEKLNPVLVIQAPSRINLINPLDAVEGAYWMPSVAVNGYKNPLSTFIYIKEIQERSRIKFYKLINAHKNIDLKIEVEDDLPKDISRLKMDIKIKTEINLILATIYRFAKTNSYFWECFINNNIELICIIPIVDLTQFHLKQRTSKLLRLAIKMVRSVLCSGMILQV